MTVNWRQPYVTIKELPDGRFCGVHRLLMHWTVHIDIHDYGHEDRYCFATRELAETALSAWEGQGDMAYWHRHPASGRRRELVAGKPWHVLREWIAH